LDNIVELIRDLEGRVRQYLADYDLRSLFYELSVDYRFAAGFLVALALLSALSFFRRSDESSAIGLDVVSAYPGLEESTTSSLDRTREAALPDPAVSTAVPGSTARATLPQEGAISTTESTGEIQSFVPVISGGSVPTKIPSPSPTTSPEPTPTPRIPRTPEPTPTPTIDFGAVRERLQDQGQDLGFSKIGFHTGVGGNRTGLGDWMRSLDAASVPFFLNRADDAGPLFDAQQILRDSDVPHTLVYRRSGDAYDTPDYNLPPEEAAQQHWQLHMEAFPAELDPEIVWIETINEVDKERSEWLGYFAIETARLALEDGFRWAAFGWSSGEPEMEDWTSFSMLEFLRFAGDFPDRIAVALHEYSYITDEIDHDYPFKVGRFQRLFEVVDSYDIPRPTLLITEWGWAYDDVASGDAAIRDIDWAARMYAPYPEIKGAALWYLGGAYESIAEEAQRLIVPVTEYSMGTYFAIPLPPDEAPIDPEQYRPR